MLAFCNWCGCKDPVARNLLITDLPTGDGYRKINPKAKDERRQKTLSVGATSCSLAMTVKVVKVLDL
uniref:Ovule protein n=1 Tax=Panagrellus redivivus TaxID=6233 RepID=A0A7E4VXY1_PANRE